MEEETLQQSADRLKNFQGNVKGEVFRVHAEYIKHKEGEGGIKKVEKRMEEIGVPIDFKKIGSFEWVSERMSSLTILAAKEVFGWTKEDVFQMGRFAPKFSFIIKVMIQYLVSIDVLVKNAEKYWDKHFDFGSIEATLKKEEKQVIIIQRGFKTHPILCTYHMGYFKGLCELTVKSENITVEEPECIYKGAEYNKFLIRWE